MDQQLEPNHLPKSPNAMIELLGQRLAHGFSESGLSPDQCGELSRLAARFLHAKPRDTPQDAKAC